MPKRFMPERRELTTGKAVTEAARMQKRGRPKGTPLLPIRIDRNLARARTLRLRLTLVVDRPADLGDRVAQDPAGMGKQLETRRCGACQNSGGRFWRAAKLGLGPTFSMVGSSWLGRGCSAAGVGEGKSIVEVGLAEA